METRQGVVSPTEVAEAASGSADRFEKRPSRPFGLWILTLVLLGSPVIHAGALLLRTRLLNFGSLRLWDGLVYFLIAPIVGVLMLRRHERARFSAYVFLSCEVLRALRIHSPTLGLLAVGFLVTCNCRRRGGSTRRWIHEECSLDCVYGATTESARDKRRGASSFQPVASINGSRAPARARRAPGHAAC
jgi:hypothetical protein